MTKQIEDIKSARSVIWPFRKMNQPMGELLDNGRITPKDLEFAAKKAYDQNVKTAADLLLRVHYARQVVWPFRKLDKPIGDLLDGGQITRKDLVYAVENARDPAVKGAAQTLLALRFASQEEPADFLVPRGDGSTIVRGHSKFLKKGKQKGVLKMVAGVVFSDRLLEEGATDYKSFAQGERGEESVIAELANRLDKRWTIYRNLQLPGSKADLDAVLVGPPGVLVVEIKAYSGSFKINRDRWHYRRAGRWYLSDKSPLKQALANKRRLEKYLAQHGLSEIPVGTAVILGRDPDYIHFHKPIIPVRRLRDLDKILEPYIQQPTLSGKQVVAVKRLLNEICPA